MGEGIENIEIVSSVSLRFFDSEDLCFSLSISVKLPESQGFAKISAGNLADQYQFGQSYFQTEEIQLFKMSSNICL